MNFSKTQNRFINNKISGYQLLKGKKSTGKSIASIYKAINLENNYCMYENDKILIITSDYKNKNKAMENYEKESKKNHFYSLFSLDKDRVTIVTMEEVINTYSQAFRRENGLAYKVINKDEGIRILEELQKEIEIISNKSNFLKKAKLGFIIDEIFWIKDSNLTLEEYLQIDRKGREKRMNKSSYTREGLFKIKDAYNKYLKENLLMDERDSALFAIEHMKKEAGIYSHIILDDSEKYTKAEIDFIKEIYIRKDYSSFIFIINSELQGKENSWLIKGRKFNTLGIEIKGKSFSFKVKFQDEKQKIISTIENYEYINLKNRRTLDFKIDSASTDKEVFLEDNITFKEDELKAIPMYNDIAAGSPIEMNEDIEGEFLLPEAWIGRGKETFILKVKGNSMIDKSISNGDLVVIKKSLSANNNDIIAASVDGEVTLKTLNLNGKEPILAPANPMYPPITLEGRDFSVLGIVIGIIKENN
ncbi:transcriptional repressor LexA [Clostridium sp.]|uniref:transcriptional repressor LexA n=1 Tax=Clostridium sp. TaxID=1506 RepID=UPI00262AC0C0|nr:transcriptional repressor LexA [Clostridium sp.]